MMGEWDELDSKPFILADSWEDELRKVKGEEWRARKKIAREGP